MAKVANQLCVCPRPSAQHDTPLRLHQRGHARHHHNLVPACSCQLPDLQAVALTVKHQQRQAGCGPLWQVAVAALQLIHIWPHTHIHAGTETYPQ